MLTPRPVLDSLRKAKKNIKQSNTRHGYILLVININIKDIK